jgi:GMP synthase (glutamine-hydrolysing)
MDDEMTSATITVVQSSPDVPLGSFEAHLASAGIGVRVVRAYDGDALPAPADLGAGLLVLGGRMSAHDDEVAPWLPALRTLLLDSAHGGVPTLAVCLGAQLLAVAAGGRVEVDAPPGREAGAARIFWRPEAAADPVVGPVARAVAAAGERASVFPAMHADAVSDLPDDAVWLASSNMYPFQAFRIGSALAVQFHPEADRDLMALWSQDDGVDAATVLAEIDESAERIARGGSDLAAAFAAHVLEAHDRTGHGVPA